MKNYLYIIMLFFIAFNNKGYTSTLKIEQIQILKVDSAINPATLNYIRSVYQKSTDSTLNIIQMNTPGGLVSTTKDILTTFASSKGLTAIWITPEGASATSAGAIISVGAHFLIMSSGTNIGAATPITIGKDIEQGDMRNKAVNDLVALVRSLAEHRGRNADFFEKMISESASYSAAEALENNFIEGIADNFEELKKIIQGRSVNKAGISLQVEFAENVKIIEIEMDLGQKLLNIFAHPEMAYILFILGIALIYFEMQAPGGFIAGSIGALCLMLAAIGFQVLPLNMGGLGLIILAGILFILETYILSYGILSIAGLVSLLFGSLFLYRTDDSLITLKASVIIGVISSLVGYLSILTYYFLRHKKVKTRFFNLEGHEGIVIDYNKQLNIYNIKVSGEIWRAKSNIELSTGDKVKIIQQDNQHLYLNVEKLS